MQTSLCLIIPIMLLLFAALMALYNVKSGSDQANQLVEEGGMEGLTE